MNLPVIPLSCSEARNDRAVALLVLPQDNETAVLVGDNCSQLSDRPTIAYDYGTVHMACRVCCPCGFNPIGEFPAELRQQCEKHGIRRVISCDGGKHLPRMEGLEKIEFMNIRFVNPNLLEPFTITASTEVSH